MNWNHLYTPSRLKKSKPSSINTFSDARNAYQRDYDRIVFSGPFRRLQDKTQVFPLPGPIFVHNRLTHSLEVASVGRSLGYIVGTQIAQLEDITIDAQQFYKEALPWVIAAACLAHDIGNPPFGHSGEAAIRTFFEHIPRHLEPYFTSLTEKQKADLLHFEGNSMALRIMTQPKCIYHNAFNLTLTTLASIIKYPCHAIEGFQKGASIAQKKSGFFTSESTIFEQIVTQFQLPKLENTQHAYARHPFVFLTEAADDICYRIIDMEDAHRLGMIADQKIFELFLPFFHLANHSDYNAVLIQQTIDKIPISEDKIAYLRANWIGLMTQLCAEVFMNHKDELLQGNMNQSLMDLLNADIAALLKNINDFSYSTIYQYPKSLEIELAGYTILNVLLDELTQAIMSPNSHKSEKIFRLLDWNNMPQLNQLDIYEKLMFVVDFVCSCTDSYAMDLYKKFRAVSINHL